MLQALWAFVAQPGRGRWREVGIALTGLKPIVETWRVLTGAPWPPEHKASPETLLSFSRMLEVLCEALPQAAVQAYVFLQTPGTPTTLQHISLAGSLVSAGYILAMVDYDTDTSPS